MKNPITPITNLELWGGIECTLARIGESYRDQTRETGHRDRPGDLDLVAGLGIRTLRYPVLWEAVTPDDPARPDWSWSDERLRRLRALGIRPIAGLTHHGGGPRYTSLVDPDYPRLFADYAGAVARRYPWLDAYTPVNEPLTTARFGALYGHWHPHRRHDGDFLRALVNQCRATVLAMRAIRRVNPAAILVQTEDVGRVFSTPELAYQADYENERRWLSLDLLHGRLDHRHLWWRRFAEHGIGETELAIFRKGDAVPDVIGVNHYLTSERFLDGRIGLYPPHLEGGNGRERYADVEAVRTRLPGAELGPAARLAEVWERYRRPIAVTEVHHGSTRDEQLRWLAEVWRAAQTLRRRGADIRAVTVWALFGSVDWNSLLVRQDGHYEPGAFDIRGETAFKTTPRPTALAAAASSLARTGRFDHPALDGPGWWRRDDRFYQRPTGSRLSSVRPDQRRLVVAGPSGPVAEAIEKAALSRGLAHVRSEGEALRRSIAGRDVWAVIDLAPRPRWRDLARACREAGKGYARCIAGAAAESGRPRRGGGAGCDALVIRTGLLFGPPLKADPVRALVERVAGVGSGAEPSHVAWQGTTALTYLPDLAQVLLDLVIDGERGVFDLVGGSIDQPALTAGIAERWASAAAGESADRRADLRASPLMPPLARALDRFVNDVRADLARREDPSRPTPYIPATASSDIALDEAA